MFYITPLPHFNIIIIYILHSIQWSSLKLSNDPINLSFSSSLCLKSKQKHEKHISDPPLPSHHHHLFMSFTNPLKNHPPQRLLPLRRRRRQLPHLPLRHLLLRLLPSRHQRLLLLHMVHQLRRQNRRLDRRPRPSRQRPRLQDLLQPRRRLRPHQHRRLRRLVHQHQLDPRLHRRHPGLRQPRHPGPKHGRPVAELRLPDRHPPPKPTHDADHPPQVLHRRRRPHLGLLRLLLRQRQRVAHDVRRPGDVDHILAEPGSRRVGEREDPIQLLSTRHARRQWPLQFERQASFQRVRRGGCRGQRRLTMGYDGNLRLFSLNETTRNWSVAWEALPHLCKVHGLCGQNGICVYAPEPKCTCPPHYEMTDRSDWNRGCKPKFNLSCDQQKIKLVELPHTDFWGYDFTFNINMSFETCRNICMSNCNCVAFRYGLDRKCYDKSALWDGYQSPEFWGTIYLKIPSDLDATVSPTSQKLLRLACNTTVIEPTLGNSGLYAERVGKTQWGYFYGFLTAIGVVEFVFIGLGWWFLFRRGGNSSGINDGYQIMRSQFRRFTYGELKKATKNFSEELGRGCTGAVYKGVLDDQRTVAVKRLEDVTQGEGEFWAEVNTIGRINHMNLVRMYGFCSERKHRLLVYEYVEYGSLDRLLFNDYAADSSLEWEERFKIAVGTAKGLAYLHHECLEWVVHCDIKPENILIDRNYEAKIADFGLMKLSQRGAPTEEMSRIRGTKGYMAPEWVLNLPITAKVDVYSFGVVLLEMLRGRRILDWEADVKSLIKVAKERLASGDDSWIEDLVDARLSGDVDAKQAETMALIAFLCVEEEAGKRPTMDKVVETLMAADVLNHEAFTEVIVESVDEFEV
ncbi:putative receptor protein kinase ZmPK1 [Acorus calamus]|uniref:non-specific serine/threonine protein kinase n=1 Tax=Acorus calamus TaxID=4465 RepID=A0AAV9F753_ACOCL|nr:putative receptor protein kinase ZmPK1 [Acorus calamus]